MPSSRRSVRSLVLLLATVLAVPLAALLGAAPAQAVAAFHVGGTVVDAFDAPLPGVTVTAKAAPAFTATVGTPVQTGVEGDYDLALPNEAGTYRLEFTKAGYVPAVYDGDTAVDLVIDADGTLVVDDEPAVDNLLTNMTLDSVATFAVSGTVKNGGGTALTGIVVEIFADGDEESPVDTDTTGGAGGYSLDVPAGNYQVRYTDPTATYLTTWYGGTESPDTVTVTAATPLADVTMTQPAPTDEFPIAGQVVDAIGAGIDGVAVAVTPVGGSTDSDNAVTAAVGENHGLYSVSVLPGTYRVAFSKDGFTGASYGPPGTPATITVAGNGTLSVAPAEELTANRLNDLVLASTPVAVTGTVQAASNDAPISGITVRAFPQGSTDPATVVSTATTNGSGGYSLALPIGEYDLEFADTDGTGDTYSPASLTGIVVSQAGAPTVPVVKLTVAGVDTPHPVVGAVVDANGAEIDGLTVSAAPQGATPGANAASTTTGADGGLGDHGRYRLMLKPGSYQLTISGSTWATTPYVHGGTAAALVTVELNGRVLVNNVEAVGGQLEDSEVLGTEKYALSGTVTNQGSTGLTGITVKAYSEDDLTTAVATATSGANGAWSLTGSQGLVVGSYVIELSGTSGGTSYDKTYVGGATPTPVEMAQGGTAKVGGVTVPSNTLTPVKMTQSSLDTLHPVTGEVVDVNFDPVDNVTVTALVQSSGTQATDQTGADGELGDHGRYRLMLKPGVYRLQLEHADFTTAVYPGTGLAPVDVTVELNGTVHAGATVVSGGELEPVELVDAVGDATISGTVLSEGSPLTGITVEVFPEGDVSEAPLAATTTSGSGAWSISTLKIGTYTIRFTDNVDDATTYVQTFLGGATLAAATPAKVGQANVVSVNEVPTAPNGALGAVSMSQANLDTTYPVTGAVTDVNGDAIGTAIVSVTVVTPGAAASSVTTDADGLFALQLKAGTYTIGFEKSGFGSASYPGPGETPVNVVVSPGSAGVELDQVSLEQSTGTTSLSGTAVAASGGAGLTGLTVEVFPEGDTTPESRVATTTTGAAGAWTVGSLKIGTYVVQFSGASGGKTYVKTYFNATGGGDVASPVKVGQNNAVSVDDVPKISGALGSTALAEATASYKHPLRGDVFDANFDPLAGVTVTATAKAGGAETATATTDEDGAYTLEVRSGTYEISYELAGFTTGYYLNFEDARAQVVVSIDGVIRILGEVVADNTLDSMELQSSTKYPLGGTVVNAANQPIAGVTVKALRDGIAVATAPTAASGAFTLQLPVGSYTIEYSDNDGKAPTYITTYFGGTATPRTVRVANGGDITDEETSEPIDSLGSVAMAAATASTTYPVSGLVIDADYEGLDGATVSVMPVGATAATKPVATGTTGVNPDDAEEHGFYSVPVKAGKYWLKYSKTGLSPAYLLDFNTYTPVTVTVSATGKLTATDYEFTDNRVDDIQLLPPGPKFTTAPKLTGKVAPNEKLTLSVGKLSPDITKYADWKDYTYIFWYLDGKLDEDADYGYYAPKYKVPADAGGKALSYRIWIEDANPDGPFLAPVEYVSKPLKIAKAKATMAKPTFKKGKLTVTVKVAGVKAPLGKIIVKDGKKKVGKFTLTAKSKGKAVIKLKGLKPGLHKLTISYSGDATTLPAKVKYKLKV